MSSSELAEPNRFLLVVSVHYSHATKSLIFVVAHTVAYFRMRFQRTYSENHEHKKTPDLNTTSQNYFTMFRILIVAPWK